MEGGEEGEQTRIIVMKHLQTDLLHFCSGAMISGCFPHPLVRYRVWRRTKLYVSTTCYTHNIRTVLVVQ